MTKPIPTIPDSERCPSMRRAILRRQGDADREVYLRCAKTDSHTGKNHDSWLFTWTDDNEDGWLEIDEEERLEE